ncbi:MAG: hypothetical protein HQM11_20825 [SAR324 cluster bacterium]|nr:hypothetical protein [SAR324 cluster bacterium]
MTPAEKDNILIWDGKTHGHYEVYYFKFNLPEQQAAFWLRYTILAPLHGFGQPVGELWGIFFDSRDPSKNEAWKQTFPLSQVRWESQRFELRIDQSLLRHDESHGRIQGKKSSISWDLKIKPQKEIFHNYPNLLYHLPFPKTKVMAPNLSCSYSGRIKAGDRVFEFKNAPGHQAHIWGKKHAHQWAWGNCNLFDDQQDAVFEALSGQIKLGGVLTPPMSMAYLKVGKEEYSFKSWKNLFGIHSRWNIQNWQMEAENEKYLLLATMSSQPEWMVGVRYTDPDGDTRVCNNTKIANLELKLIAREQDKQILRHHLKSTQGCAFEVVGPHAQPAVPVKI